MCRQRPPFRASADIDRGVADGTHIAETKPGGFAEIK
jgi:hypothetical protein